MHEIDYRVYLQVLDQIGDHFIYPRPVELASLRLDLIPGHAPPNCSEAQIAA